MMTSNNKPIIRNVLVLTSQGCQAAGRDRVALLKKTKPEEIPTWKSLLSQLYGLQVALLGVDLEIAKLRGGTTYTAPPAILEDQEFFGE